MFGNLAAKLFGRHNSNVTAKNRLQMVLVQDRSGLTSQDMDAFRDELLDVISKYFVLERKNLEIEWERSDNTTALIINTPVVGRPEQPRALKPAAATS